MFNTERNDKQTRCLIETALNKADATNRHVEAWSAEEIEVLQRKLETLKAKEG